MKFGEVPVAEAEGAILAHSLRLGTVALKKARVLSQADLDLIAEAGLSRIVVARLEPGDVGEDEAAWRIAAAATGDEVETAAPFTGRANLFAKTRGLLVFDRERLEGDALGPVLPALDRPGGRVRQLGLGPGILPQHGPELPLDPSVHGGADRRGPLPFT